MESRTFRPHPARFSAFLRITARALIWLLASLAGLPALAGVLDAERLRGYFPAPFIVGERDPALPVWPIFKQDGPATDLVCYVFESADFASIPGFSGTPMNLLVALDPNGQYLDVRVLSQHEPVFLDGLGEEPLFRFVTQYRGLSLKQTIKIGSGPDHASRSGSTNAYIDGVAKATASIRILNQSVLSSALKVARAKLGYSGGKDPDLVAHVRADLYESMDWEQMQKAGLVRHLQLRNRDVDSAFAGSAGEDADADSKARPDDGFIDLYAALASIPSAGRNLLAPAAWKSMSDRTGSGDLVLLLMSRGRYSFVPDDFVRASVPDRLALKQEGLPIELRDLDLDGALQPAAVPAFDTWKAFRVIAAAGLDPGRPMVISLRVVRTKGIVFPERVARDFDLKLDVPDRFIVPAPEDQKGWQATWKAHWASIGLLLAALVALAWLLQRQHALVSDWRRLRLVRPLFLVFTLVFIGWYAQAQLSIVNVVAVVQALFAGRGLGFFLYDPLTVLLWLFTLAALLVWGRGTFCGWLCPYGALQELAAIAARALRLPRLRLKPAADQRLKRVKYGVLLVILGAAAWSPRAADMSVEVEPFKTAITLAFVRSWPFVLYAALLVAAGAVVNKFFCRYLCPLGAWLALLGRMRRFDWIARRAECGTPCQTCRHRCEYQAISPQGQVDYSECFQCMDCVAIHSSDRLCAPRILEAKGRRMIALAPRPPQGPGVPGAAGETA